MARDFRALVATKWLAAWLPKWLKSPTIFLC